ncbi:MAG: hypothetical protein HYV40_02715 [Candidatus Levybacteria bacterium]|nr:hypothetical protein [Candidatus Levybacteria bacterium]
MHLKGQSLVTILIVVIIAMTLAAGAIMLTVTNTIASSAYSLGNEAYYVAESGAENAVIRLLRDKSYSGETLAVGENTATVTVSGSDPYVIVSSGRAGNFVRKVQVTLGYPDSIMTITSWKEIP